MFGFSGNKNNTSITQNINGFIDHSIIVQAGQADNLNLTELVIQLNNSKHDIKLLNRLVFDKLKECEDYIYKNQYNTVIEITDTLLSYNPLKLEPININRLYLLRFIAYLLIPDKNKYKDSYDLLTGEYLDSAKEMLILESDKKNYTCEELLNKEPVVQNTILSLLFNKCEFNNIVDLASGYTDFVLNKYNEIPEFISSVYYLIGLSACNCREYNAAIKYITKSCQFNTSNKKLYNLNYAKFLSLLIKKMKTSTIINEIKQTYYTLDELVNKDTSLIDTNIEQWQWISLQYFAYIEPNRFIEYYNTLSSESKEKEFVIFYYAHFLLCQREYESALVQYQRIQVDKDIVVLKAHCMSMLKKYESIVNLYEENKNYNNSNKLKSFYFEALKNLNYEQFELKLQEKLKTGLDVVNFIELFSVVAQDERVYLEWAQPFIRENYNDIKKIDNFLIRLDYFCLFLIHGENEYIESFLNLLEDTVLSGNEDLCKNIYSYLYGNKKLDSRNIILICTKFVDAKVMHKEFLMMRSLAYRSERDYSAALADIEEAYIIESDYDCCIQAIDLLLKLNVFPLERYVKYIDTLKDSMNPFGYSVIAVAYSDLEDCEKCKEYAYKSIYLLNGDLTTDISNNIFYAFLICARDKSKIDYKCISDDTVVTLYSNEDEKDKILICLEKGDFFHDCLNNKSLEIKHINESHPLYYRLIDISIGDTININDKQYTVAQIISKYAYMFRYVLNLHDKNPEKYGTYIKTINADNPQLLLKELANCMPDENNQLVTLVQYHSEDPSYPEIGVPLDIISNNGYDNYLRVISMLLFAEDQAFYAGEMNYSVGKSKLVMSLSSLVVLAIFDWLDYIDIYKENIIIPTSLLEFINRYRKKAHANGKSSYLYKTKDGQIHMEEDSNSIKIWDKIYECCYKLNKVDVNINVRKELKILDKLSAENMFCNFHIDLVQLDCFALAKQLNAVVVCDDAFLRNFGAAMNISSVNTNYFVLKNSNVDVVISQIKTLAKSNYIFVDKVLIEFARLNDITILEDFFVGKRKSSYYYQYFKDMGKSYEPFIEKYLQMNQGVV